MSNIPTKTELNTPAEKLQALQYLVDAAHNAPFPQAVHKQIDVYAQALFNLLVLSVSAPAAPVSVADAIAAVTAPEVEAEKKSE
jgi:hypothetical protein